MCRGSIPVVSRARGGAGERRHGRQFTAAAAAAEVQRNAGEREEKGATAAGRKGGGGLGFGRPRGGSCRGWEQVERGPGAHRAAPCLSASSR